MFVLQAEKTRLKLIKKEEPITSGSVNIYQARFQFSPDWEGLEKIAVFQAGCVSRSVPLEESGTCMIPWEPMVEPGPTLSAGVYGTMDGRVVLPTIWASLGTIYVGTTQSEGSQPPTPELWKLALKDVVRSDELDAIRVIDRGEYLDLEEKDPRTLYLLRG